MTTAEQNPHGEDEDLDLEFDPDTVDEVDDDAEYTAAVADIENAEARSPEREDISPKEMDRLLGID